MSESSVRRRWWLVVGGVLGGLALIGVIVFALNMGRSQPVAQPSPGTASPTVTSEPQPSESSPTRTDTPSTSSSPTPRTTKSMTPYCVAYQAILDSGPKGDAPDEEGGADLNKLSATYGALIEKYSAAAKLAPAQIKDDYARVLRYLKDIKITIDSGDWNAVRAQLRLLVKLNSAMDSIQNYSDKIC